MVRKHRKIQRITKKSKVELNSNHYFEQIQNNKIISSLSLIRKVRCFESDVCSLNFLLNFLYAFFRFSMLTKMRLQLSTTQSIQSYSRATSGYCHRLGTVMYPWEWNSTSVMVTNTLFTLVRLIWKTHLCLLQSFPTFTLKFKPQPVKSGFSVKDPNQGRLKSGAI